MPGDEQNNSLPLAIRLPDPFNSNATNLDLEWKRFRQEFEIYLMAAALDVKSKRSVALLLNIMGREALQIYNSFSPTGTEKLESILQKFEEHFTPKKNVIFERFKFNQILQKRGQKFEDYIIELKNAVKTCEYKDQVDELVRDRVVIGITCKSLQERMLRESKLTLTMACDMCKAAESTATQVQVINGSENTAEPVQAVFTMKNCKRCGTKHPINKCPAFQQKCEKCHKFNHFAKVCRTKIKKNWNHKKIHQLEARENASSVVESTPDESLYVYSVTSEKTKQWTKILQVENKEITFKVDTGAETSILPLSLYKELNTPDNSLMQTDVVLVAYGGQEIKPIGLAKLNCSLEGKTHKIDFYVVDMKATPLFGFTAIMQIGLIQNIDCTGVDKAIFANKNVVQQRYKDLFEGLGEYPKEYKISVRSDVTPSIQPARCVPLAIHDKLKSKLDEMELQGIIQKVNKPTDWVNSLVIVVKKNGDLRLCIDPVRLNSAIKREHYPIPTADNIAARLSGMKYFTVMDMKDGYLQVKLSQASSDLTTFNTPFGRYKFCRLAFGLSSAPEVYMRMNNEIFGDLPGIGIYFDDIIISGSTLLEHDRNLLNVLERARQNNIKFNINKMQFRQSTVKYMGQVFSQKGISPDQNFVQAVTESKVPENKTELLRVLGMAKYLAKFIPNMSKLTAPLRELTRENVPWTWSTIHENSLKNLKQAIVQAPVLKYFNPNEEVIIQCDASKDGLGACILQNEHPVIFASRSMTKSEQLYAQIEKELLAITFAVEKFHYFIYGRHAIVQSDHKPLESIFKKDLCNAPARLQRLMLKLLNYNVKIKYTPGSKLLIADFLSRASLSNTNNVLVPGVGNTDKQVVHDLATRIPMSETRKVEFREATANDGILSKLINYVTNGWPARHQVQAELKHYYNFKKNIRVIDGLIFFDKKIVVPSVLRTYMLQLIHEGHLGINKCKRRARQCLYWKGISVDIEKYVSNCPTCIKFSNLNVKEPLKQHDLPKRAWQRVATDIFTFSGRDYLVVIDSYSNWIEMSQLQSKDATHIIYVLKSIFSRFGIPEVLQADNNPFNSEKFLIFAKDWDFQCIFSSPKYPQSNGLAEKGVNICKNMLKKCIETKTDINIALLNYRNTELADIKYSPAQLLLNKSIKTKLPCNTNILKPSINSKAVEYRIVKRKRQKLYYDKNSKSLSKLCPGNSVVYYDVNKRSWYPASVISVCKEPRSYIIQTKSGSTLRRNRKFLKPVTKNCTYTSSTNVSNLPHSCECSLYCNGYQNPSQSNHNDFDNVAQVPSVPRYHLRDRTQIAVPSRYR